MIDTVFLDMDGVLVDFTKGIHRKLGLDFDYQQWPYAKGPDGWNFHRELGYTFDQLSALCDFDFWTTLGWTEDGHDILKRVLEAFPGKRIVLLTTPMPHIMSASGKAHWVEAHLPTYSRHLIVTSEAKHILAGPNTLLIDDNQNNFTNWASAEGNSILVPRPWNDLHKEFFAGNTIKHVEESLSIYSGTSHV